MRELLDRLERSGLLRICVAGERDDGFQLARPAEKISVSDLLVALRGGRMSGGAGEQGECGRAVGQVISELERSISSVAESRSLADILSEVPEAGVAPV
jgi:DNA-binding IscR family transcriptional regulator